MSTRGWRGADAAQTSGRGWERWLALLAVAGLLAIAGCGGAAQAGGAPKTTPTRAATHTATHAAGATTPSPSAAASTPATLPAVTPATITDLGTFRQKFSDAFTSGKWDQIQPLLSPELSFECPECGSHLLMPYSATNLKQYYSWGAPWSSGSDYELSIHGCYGGNTPFGQQIGFDAGQNGAYMMFGIQRWQTYWLVSWGFEDPQGGYDGCISGDG
jgi:hypothetical protein